MKTQIIIVVIIAFCIASGCTAPQLLLHNSLADDVDIAYQAPYNPKPVTVTVASLKDTLISFQEYPQEDADLMLIVIKTTKSADPTYLRFSGSYLTSRRSGMRIPFMLSDTIKFKKKMLHEELNAIDDHSYYYLVQELYNAKRYAECINAIESMTPEFVKSSPHKGDLRGMLTLAYFSALKLRLTVKADSYWKLIEKTAVGYSRYLKDHDLELATMHAG